MPEPIGSPGAPSLAGRTVSLLLARAAEGDRESSAALVERVGPLLVMYARKQLRPPLDTRYEPADIVNDAWARLLPRLGEIKPSDGRLTKALLKYAATVINNRLRDLARAHHGATPLTPASATAGGASPGVDPPDAGPGIVSVVARREVSERLYTIIDALPPRDREIILLRGIGQHSNEDVAATIGVRHGTVAVRYHRALDKLRKLVPMSLFDDLFAEES